MPFQDKALLKLSDIKNSFISNFLLKNYDKAKLEVVDSAKIYYWYYGRNAWHTTWIQRYLPNSMYNNLQSTKTYIESIRKQGSVFYINEMPSLVLKSKNFSLVVTQINTTCPLQDYSIKKNINILKKGTLLKDIVDSFKYNSPFWRNYQPQENSIIILYASNDDMLEKLKTTKLKIWQSQSYGKNYYLSWNITNKSISQASVLRIVKQAKSNIK